MVRRTTINSAPSEKQPAASRTPSSQLTSKKRRCASSGETPETRRSKRTRSTSHHEAGHQEPRGPEDVTTKRTENLDENPAPSVDQQGTQVEETQVDEEVVDKRIVQAIRRYEQDDYVERDLWDTLLQLSYQHSQDLSRALVHWGRVGGLRDTRTSKTPANNDPTLSHPAPETPGINSHDSEVQIYDPTASTFTLWPLPLQSCPTPEWTLDEELSALITHTERERSGSRYTDKIFEDDESNDDKTDPLVDKNRETLIRLLNDLYECHPPHTSSIPIFTRGKRYKKQAAKSKKLLNRSTQPPDPTNEQVDFGLGWEFVLGVANATMNVKASVIQRARERLAEMYRVPLEPPPIDKRIGNSSDSQSSLVVNLDPPHPLHRYRKMKPLAIPDDQS